MLRLSDQARKQGVLAIEPLLPELRGAPFCHGCMAMVVDGTPGDEVEKIMQRELHATHGRHLKSAGVLRKAAEVSPAMGLIGTLVGLVQMLGNLEDPTTIGPSMAVALLTTFYGAILANMVFSPLASKLERIADEEALLNRIYLTAAASIGRRENPRRLEVLLNSLLSPAKRVALYS